MGGTKSKVDGTPDEESDESTQTSESTYENTEYSRNRHDRRRGRRNSPRKKRPSDFSTPSPDEILDKPFTYRSRKDRLLESLNTRAGHNHDDSAVDSSDKDRNGKISVKKIVQNLQANLNARSGSSSSIKVAKKPHENALSNDSLINTDKQSHRRKSASKVPSNKGVKPTGVEEKIIESLIQPRRRRSLPRSTKIKDSTRSLLSDPVAAFSNEVSKGIVPKPPEPPPIDFHERSSGEESEKAKKKMSTLTSSIQGEDVIPFDSIVTRNVPSHLKELKLRFSNDVPRSPHEDNLNSASVVERSPTKQLEKPNCHQEPAPNKLYFTNNVPVADSLHILADKPSSPKVVIRGAKVDKPNERTSKRRNSQGTGSKQSLVDNGSDTANQGGQPLSCPKSVLKTDSQEDGVIKCFPVKAEYSSGIKGIDCGRIGKDDKNPTDFKTARTQTSCLGLVESAVQTLPDIEPHGRRIKTDGNDYNAAIDDKARKVLRRVSMDKSVDRKTVKEKKGRRYRNGSTQWEDVDLLDASSCSKLNQKGSNVPNKEPVRQVASKERERRRSKSRPRRKTSELLARCEPKDCGDCSSRNEVCCMHVQVIPDPKEKRSTRRESKWSKNSERLCKQKSNDLTLQEDCNFCEGCSRSGLSTEKLSAWATYSTSSGRSRELSLLSPYRSTSTVRSKNKPEAGPGAKNEDVYRQMEELGLGFLRDGEWGGPYCR